MQSHNLVATTGASRYTPVGTLYFVSHDVDDQEAEKHLASSPQAVDLLTRPPGKPGKFVIEMHGSENYLGALQELPR